MPIDAQAAPASPSRSETEARRTLVAAGVRLLDEGLVARTWGNISLRLGPATFLVSPSGVPWREVRPEDLSIVNIADLAWEGARRPSSERGLHGMIYAAFPETGAVIHTHQTAISPWIAARLPLEVPAALRARLGPSLPVAAYALPGTPALARAALRAFEAAPRSPAVLLANHGLVARGADLEDAFRVAESVEALCAGLLPPLPPPPGRPDPAPASGGLEEFIAVLGELRPGAFVHHSTRPWTLAFSAGGRPLRPLLDDLAQLGGISFTILPFAPRGGAPGRRRALARALGSSRGFRSREALLVEGRGALCLGADAEEAGTVAQVLEKGALAVLGAEGLGGGRPLSSLDAAYMRWYYLRHYRNRGAGPARGPSGR